MRPLPPLPPPPPSPPAPTPPGGAYARVFTVSVALGLPIESAANGTIGPYVDAVRASLEAYFPEVGNITIDVAPGSVQLTARLVVPTTGNSNETVVEVRLQTLEQSSANQLQSALGIQLLQEVRVAASTLETINAPSPPPLPPAAPLRTTSTGAQLREAIENAILGAYSQSIEVPAGARLELDRDAPFQIAAGLSITINVGPGSSTSNRTVIDGRGAARLFDVYGNLRLSDVDLRNGRARLGGAMLVYSGGVATLTRVRITDSYAVGAGGEAADDAKGGCVQVDPDAVLSMYDSEIARCTVANLDSVAGSALGGGIFSQGSLLLTSSTIANCNASSRFANGGQGGGIFIAAGSAMLFNATVIRANIASGRGNTVLLGGGSANYQLPAAPGRWIAGSACVVSRAGCPLDSKGGLVDANCPGIASVCSMLTDPAAQVNGVTCQPQLPVQPCDWRTSPQLLGYSVQAIPPGALDEPEYPFTCAAGFFGSSDVRSQTASTCAGPCPAGYACASAGTIEPILCPAGHVCPAGTAVPLPCLSGTFSDVSGVTSQASCEPCPPGHACPPGATAPAACTPGSVATTASLGECDPCPAGTYQDRSGATSCRACTVGSYCVQGTATPVACPPGLMQPLQGASTIDACNPCPAGAWCTAGLAVPCGLDTYNAEEGASDLAACLPCPTHSSTAGRTLTAQSGGCICEPGYYDQSLDQRDGVPPNCQPCPPGTECDYYGAKLLSLPLAVGHFRPTNSSIDVQRCPDAETPEVSGCRGGNTSNGGCAQSLTGIFCMLCDRSSVSGLRVFYAGASQGYGVMSRAPAECRDCELLYTSQETLTLGAVLLTGVLLVAMASLRCSKEHWGSLRRRHLSNSGRLWSVAGIPGKLKILVGFFMIVTRIETVYGVVLPAAVLALLNIFRVAVSLGFESLSASFDCLGVGGYVTRLTVWIALPAGSVVVIVAAVAVWLRCHDSLSRRSLVSHALPLVLQGFFIFYPIVTNVAFEVFSCYEFSEGAWLRADVSIECNTPAHSRARLLAWTAIVLYPIGMLALNAGLLFTARHTIHGDAAPTVLSEAIAFLYQEYEPVFFWWELIEMARRFVLVGAFMLVWPGSLVQLILGTVTAAMFLLVQIQARPYKRTSDNYLASAASFCLLIYFLCCVMYKISGLVDSVLPACTLESSSSGLCRYFAIDTATLTIVTISTLLATLVVSFIMVTKQVAAESERLRREAQTAKVRRLLYCKDNLQATPINLSGSRDFHLFLSHTWAQGQSDMRVLKTRLLEMMPDLKVFLDVDNLEEGAGAEYIDDSSAVLAFCTKRYFSSRACAREIFRAVLQGKQIIAVLEPQRTEDKGGLTMEECRQLLIEDAYVSCRAPGGAQGAPRDRDWVSRWELDAEVQGWGVDWGREALQPPTPHSIFNAMFLAAPIEWSRFSTFQDITIRLIAERLLPKDHPPVYVQGEITHRRVKLAPLALTRSHHLYISPNNVSARKLASELQSIVFGMYITENFGELGSCEHMLLYLTSKTWTSGEVSAALAHEVCEAQRLGVHLLLAHEMPSVIADTDERHACAFNDFWNDGWTPRWLLQGDANVYKQIAIALKGGEWRPAGITKLAMELAKGGGARERWLVEPAEPGYVSSDSFIKEQALAARPLVRANSRRRVAPFNSGSSYHGSPGRGASMNSSGVVGVANIRIRRLLRRPSPAHPTARPDLAPAAPVVLNVADRRVLRCEASIQEDIVNIAHNLTVGDLSEYEHAAASSRTAAPSARRLREQQR